MITEATSGSSEAMKVRGDLAGFMQTVQQRDKTLWQKVRTWFQELTDKLKKAIDAYRDYTPDSPEGRMVEQMEDALEVLQEAFAEGLVDASENYQAVEGQKNTTREGGWRYSERDYPIDPDVQAVVDTAINTKKSGEVEVGKISQAENKAINRLSNIGGDGYRGKFTGGNHRVTYDNIRHALNQHSDIVREALRAQLPLTAEDVARTISAVKNGRSKIQNTATRTKEGRPSLLHAVEVNGYTLYAEEIALPKQKGGTQDLLGKTMYKEPTMPTASVIATSAKLLPKRQGEALYEYNTPNGATLSRGFVANANGDAALLHYSVLDGKAVRENPYGGVIFLSADRDVVSNRRFQNGSIRSGYVYIRNPYVITRNNPVYVESSAKISELVRKLKGQGYDGFIFDYKVGDNYAVMIFNEAQIVSDLAGYTKLSDRDSSGNIWFSDRDPTAAATAAEIKKQNKDLEKDVRALEELLKAQEKGRAISSSDLFTVAEFLKKASGVTDSKQHPAPTAELAKILGEFYGYIRSGEELSWNGISQKAQPVADWLRSHTPKSRERVPGP